MLYLTAQQIADNYGIGRKNVYRFLTSKGCPTKTYIYNNRTCYSYPEEYVKRIFEEYRKMLEERKRRKANVPEVDPNAREKAMNNYPPELSNKLYQSWRGMIWRTFCSNGSGYEARRKKGVGMSKEWLTNFEAFADWSLNNGVENTLSLDRIDNDHGYYPWNCRWTTPKIQANNTSVNNRVMFKGKEYTISELSDFCGIPYKTLWDRICSKGWDVERAATEKIGSWKKGYSAFGKTQYLQEWAREYNIDLKKLHQRITRDNKTIEEALAMD